MDLTRLCVRPQRVWPSADGGLHPAAAGGDRGLGGIQASPCGLQGGRANAGSPRHLWWWEQEFVLDKEEEEDLTYLYNGTDSSVES